MNSGFLGKDQKVSPCLWCVVYLLLDYTLFIACCIRDFKFFRFIYIEYLWFVYYWRRGLKYCEAYLILLFLYKLLRNLLINRAQITLFCIIPVHFPNLPQKIILCWLEFKTVVWLNSVYRATDFYSCVISLKASSLFLKAYGINDCTQKQCNHLWCRFLVSFF